MILSLFLPISNYVQIVILIGNSGTFGKLANENDTEKELRQLRKENKQLKMEVDV